MLKKAIGDIITMYYHSLFIVQDVKKIMARQKSKNSNKKQVSQKPAENKSVFLPVLLIGLMTLFIFLSLCFDVTGVAGRWVKSFLIGIMGVSAYILPLLLIHIIVALFSKNNVTRVRVWFGAVALLLFSVFLHIVSSSAYIYQGIGFIDLVKALYKGGISVSGGGVLGGLIATPIIMLLDKIGGAIIVGVLLTVSVVLALYPLFTALKKFIFPFSRSDVADTVAQTVQTEEITDKYIDMRERHREKREAEKEQKRLEKEEKAKDREARAIAFAEKSESIDRTNSTIEDIPVPEVPKTKPQPQSDQRAEKVMDALNKAPIVSTAFDEDMINAFDDEMPPEAEATQIPEPVYEEHIEAAPEQMPEEQMPPIKEPPKETEYIFPDIALLNADKAGTAKSDSAELKKSAQKLIETLDNFGVKATVANISKGPAVTRYELLPGVGVRVNKFTNLADDIALALKATGVRIEANASGTGTIGIEVANEKTVSISLRRIIASNEFKKSESKLTAALGLDIAGNTITVDLARMPHLLIAGATGSGKSVCINSLIMSILYKARPDEVRMLMVDPKCIELDPYNGIPHLISPVVTDPKKAAGALKWAVGEMLNRYKLFSETSSKNIQSYNAKMEAKGEKKLPYILIVIDELADLMMSSPHEVEDSICRLAQMARAAGMHLVIATQRPSADVITGLIKTNIPSRIAFAVASQIDSRIILDSMGAEKLLGKGDMLYLPMGQTRATRIQGCFVSESEIDSVTEFIRNNHEKDQYDDEVIKQIEANTPQANAPSDDEDAEDTEDPMLNDAIRVVVENGKASTSMLQLKLRLGYARAGRLIDTMESMGIIGPYEGSKPRKVLMTKDEWQERQMRMSD